MRFFRRFGRRIKKKRPVSTARRIGWVRWGAVAVVVLLAARLGQLQLVQHAFWEQQAELVRRRIHSLAAPRGRILDRHGMVRAENERSYDVVLDLGRLLTDCTPLLMAEMRTYLEGEFFGLERVLGDPEGSFERLFALTAVDLKRVRDPSAGASIRTHGRVLFKQGTRLGKTVTSFLRGRRTGTIVEDCRVDTDAIRAKFAAWRERLANVETALEAEPLSLVRYIDERRRYIMGRWQKAARQRAGDGMTEDDIARERVDYLRRLRSHPAVFRKNVAYDPIVPLLTMERERHVGILVVARMRRLYPIEVAPGLIGQARGPKDEDKELFRKGREEIDDLRKRIYRSPADQKKLERLTEKFRTVTVWPDDVVGRTGLEKSFEKVLRGERGYRIGEWDRTKSNTTTDPREVQPKAGQDIVLTLDAAMQLEAERVLGMTSPPGADDPVPPYHESPKGAMVLIDVETGDVLVLASRPRWTRLEYTLHYAVLLKRKDKPLWPRAYQPPRIPEPGSLLKPIYSLEALSDEAFDPRHSIVCGGRYGRRGPRCDNHRLGMNVNMATALKKSCNTYYCGLARDLGPVRLVTALRNFGFGARTGAITGEFAGRLPDSERLRGGSLSNLAIGQAEVETTPLQLAVAFAGIATGRLPRARVVRSIAGVDQPTHSTPLPYSEHAFQEVRRGLMGVTEGGGTASIFTGFDIRVAGKTGTAQGGTSRAIPNHAWFAGYFPAEAPRYAIVVYAEHCGVGGGHFAAPLARTFLESKAAHPLVESLQR